jgi:hypothetical protein
MKTNYATRNTQHAVSHLILTLSLFALLLASCQPAPVTADPGIVMTAAFETAVAQLNTPTETPAPPSHR